MYTIRGKSIDGKGWRSRFSIIIRSLLKLRYQSFNNFNLYHHFKNNIHKSFNETLHAKMALPDSQRRGTLKSFVSNQIWIRYRSFCLFKPFISIRRNTANRNKQFFAYKKQYESFSKLNLIFKGSTVNQTVPSLHEGWRLRFLKSEKLFFYISLH